MSEALVLYASTKVVQLYLDWESVHVFASSERGHRTQFYRNINRQLKIEERSRCQAPNKCSTEHFFHYVQGQNVVNKGIGNGSCSEKGQPCGESGGLSIRVNLIVKY